MKVKATIFLNATLLTAVLFNCGSAFAQSAEDGKNLVKLNVGALFLKSFSVQYERAIAPKTSLALGLRIMPESNVPFEKTIENLIDDSDTWERIKDFKTSNFAFTPEVRFYFGKDVFRGFYLAPFARIAKYTAEVPLTFDVEETNSRETILVNGDVTAVTAGLLVGAQWKLAKQIHLDWWIAGPNYGFSNGDLSGKRPLNAQEQEAVREELRDLEDLAFVKPDYTVDENGFTGKVKGPWAGLRAGLSIGYRF